MKLIKLTSAHNSKPVYINIEYIGHMFEVGKDKLNYTVVGVTTHNNGGFEVKETVEQIIFLINRI